MASGKQRLTLAVKSSVNSAVNTIFTWFGIPLDSVAGGQVAQHWSAQSRTTGQVLTVQESEKLSAVWACVRLISGTIASLPLRVYKINEADGSHIALPQHAIQPIIGRNPNRDMTANQFWEVMLRSMLLWGDGFAEVQRIGSRVISLKFLLPQRLTRNMLFDGSIQYLYTDFDAKQYTIDEKNLLRIPGITDDGRNGLSVIAYMADVLGMARAGGEAAGKLYENGMRPAGMLSVDAFLTPAQREDVRANILPSFSGSGNAGKTLVGEGGMKWQSIGLPPGDAQMLESRKFSVEEICRWYSVPPNMVGLAQTSNYGTGIEQQTLGFLMFCLQPWLTRVEQAVARRMLSPAEQDSVCVEFNTDGLMRADSAGRAAYYSSMANNGIFTRNEIRRKEKLADVEGGDELTVPAMLTLLSKVGEAPAPGGAGLPSQPDEPAAAPGETP